MPAAAVRRCGPGATGKQRAAWVPGCVVGTSNPVAKIYTLSPFWIGPGPLKIY
jgi:hypothetical protein